MFRFFDLGNDRIFLSVSLVHLTWRKMTEMFRLVDGNYVTRGEWLKYLVSWLGHVHEWKNQENRENPPIALAPVLVHSNCFSEWKNQSEPAPAPRQLADFPDSIHNFFSAYYTQSRYYRWHFLNAIIFFHECRNDWYILVRWLGSCYMDVNDWVFWLIDLGHVTVHGGERVRYSG